MTDPHAIVQAFKEAHRHRLDAAYEIIAHCVDQLSEDDVHWRPYEAHNSIGTVLLHLCGNLGQWMIAGVGGTTDTRDRPTEFTDRTRHPKVELLRRLRETIDRSIAVLDAVPDDEIIASRRIQGFEVNVLKAIVETVNHLSGHAQEIIWITRLRRGDAYEFQWVPTTPEEGAAV